MPKSDKYDVFISYSHKDKPTADAVCSGLESHGIRCWIAPRDILPSMSYPAALNKAIIESRVLVLIFSSNSNNSPHVIREVERAVSNNLAILPFRIEDTPLSDDLVMLISLPHWLDALTPPMEKNINILSEKVEFLLSSDKSWTPASIRKPFSQKEEEQKSFKSKVLSFLRGKQRKEPKNVPPEPDSALLYKKINEDENLQQELPKKQTEPIKPQIQKTDNEQDKINKERKKEVSQITHEKDIPKIHPQNKSGSDVLQHVTPISTPNKAVKEIIALKGDANYFGQASLNILAKEKPVEVEQPLSIEETTQESNVPRMDVNYFGQASLNILAKEKSVEPETPISIEKTNEIQLINPKFMQASMIINKEETHV